MYFKVKLKYYILCYLDFYINCTSINLILFKNFKLKFIVFWNRTNFLKSCTKYKKNQ